MHTLMRAALLGGAMGFVVVVPTVLQAQQASAEGTYRVVAFAGGGFAGRSVRQAVQLPAFSSGPNGAPVVVTDSVDLTRDGSFNWRPTVSTGVLLTRELKNEFYVGVSGYFAFLTEDDSETRPSPGLAMHFGQDQIGIFVGYVFTSSHDVAMPDGADRIRVARDNIPDLRTSNTSSFGRWYIGFSGVSVNIAGGQ